MAYEDGTFTSAKQNGPKRVTFPYLNTPSQDAYARIVERDYVIEPDSYSPTAATRTSNTNDLTYSNALTNAAWTKTGVTATDNLVANPWDGTVTTARILETAATSEHYFFRAYTFAGGTGCNFSVIAKGISRTRFRLFVSDGATNYTAFFDLSNGTTDNASNCVGSVQSLGDSFYICSISFVPAAGVGSVFFHCATTGTTINYTGDTAKGFYIAQAQLEIDGDVGPLILTTSTARTVSAPATDYSQNSTSDTQADLFAFIVSESPGVVFGQGYWSFSRRYARIPATQTSYGSQLLVRPAMHDLVSGSTYAVSFDDGATSHLFTARKTVTAVGAITPAGATESDTLGALGAAQITVTLNNSSRSFYANDSDATIWNALSLAWNGTTTYAAATYFPLGRSNGLLTIGCSGVNVTVFGYSSTSSSIEVSLGSGRDLGAGSSTLVILEIASVEATTAINPEAPTNVRTLTSTAHGGAVGEFLAVWNGDKLIGTTKVLAVAANTVTVAADEHPWAIGSLAATHMQFADISSTRYVNGPISVTTKIEESFYLPGVTSGITTAADIPLVAPKTDAISWLAAIVAGTTFLPIQGSDLTQWEGPIYKQTTVSAQMSDALDTVSASA